MEKRLVTVLFIGAGWFMWGMGKNFGYKTGYKDGEKDVTVYLSHHMDSLFRRFDSVERKYHSY